MDIALDFTTGLSQGVAWPWPIAVYLFLAGISGGAVAVAIIQNFCLKAAPTTPVMKSAALIGFITIVLGMVCLVLDLTNPLVFWRILISYNPVSVMSLGVMVLLFYIPLCAVLVLLAFSDSACFAPFKGALDKLAPFAKALEWVVLILAVAVCAYTGFLISALIRFPLINTAVLPALFVASGFSAGCASVQMLSVCFGENREGKAIHTLHLAEYPIVIVEALCLFMIAVALISGTSAMKAASAAFICGTWAWVFWGGAVLVGIVIPILIGIVPAFRRSTSGFWIGGTCAVIGMMCLRLFILYAGQLNPM